MLQNKKIFLTYLSAALILFCFFTLPVIYKLAAYCYHNYDTGIYAQIINESSLFNPNPYLSTMDIYKLQDHFHIFLGLISSFSIFFSSAAKLGIYLDYLFPVLSFLPVWYLFHKKTEFGSKNQILIFSIFYLLMNKGVTSAIHYPIHQDLWATFPILLFGMFFFLGNYWGTLLSAIFLILFKEVFQFAIVMVGVLLCYRKNYKLGIPLILICVSWVLVVWGIRPHLVGNYTLPKGHDFIGKLLLEPHKLILQYSGRWDLIRRFIEFHVPFIPIIYLSIKQKVKFNWEIAPIIIAPFLLNFIPMMWRHHYGAPYSAFLFLILLPLNKNFIFPKKALALSIILIFALNGGYISKGIKRVTRSDQTKLCPAITERISSLNFATNYLVEHPDGKALVQAHIIPNLAIRKDIYQVGLPSFPGNNIGPFKYVLVEKPDKFGDKYPMPEGTIPRLIETWKKSPNIDIIQDNDWIFFAKGSFTSFD
ncbi:hypothetical protein [Halobacteriovorax sp. HLS]|uniref:hypothetical protein n=1 Tax=Halobacteriovorax sp. HLS TaxID=2234000 RepID=UPI000FDC0D92|nr:hypothetical protein [Halobacteriovorax sp. HLS]